LYVISVISVEPLDAEVELKLDSERIPPKLYAVV
jgi:hypothetical protein